MSGFLSDAGLVVTAALGWVTQVVDVITSEPMLLMFAILPLVSLGISLVRRLLRIN